MSAMTKRVAFRLSDEELEMLKDQCECNGQTMTEYIKFLILNDSEPIGGNEINLKGGEE
jgi:predicted DNA-binding protein